jgi:hypothetical protein
LGEKKNEGVKSPRPNSSTGKRRLIDDRHDDARIRFQSRLIGAGITGWTFSVHRNSVVISRSRPLSWMWTLISDATGLSSFFAAHRRSPPRTAGVTQAARRKAAPPFAIGTHSCEHLRVLVVSS